MKVLLSRDEIQRRVAEMGREIDRKQWLLRHEENAAAALKIRSSAPDKWLYSNKQRNLHA